MPTITLESSERSKKKSRLRSNLRSYGTRHGDSFWEEEKQRKNFGLKYMNKFGWNKGEGLGKHKQGNTNSVKTKFKNDNKGIGCKNTHNDTMFQATMCMFNDILSGLNTKKDSNTSNASTASIPAPSTTKHLTASAVIKSYEAKHHLYGKFRAAKNISNRSEQDKSELFGNVTKGFTENDQTNYAMQMSAISSGYSGKRGLGFGQSDDNNMNRDTLMFGKFTRSGIITREDIVDDQIETEKKSDIQFETEKKKKKKKSKKKKTDKGNEETKKKKKKKKKKDKNIVNDDINIVICDRINVEVNEETKSKKKKKKKKGKKRRLTENEDDIVIEPPLKKMKVNGNRENVNGNLSDVSSTASILSSMRTPIQSDVEVINEVKKLDKKSKKKKKKKDKDKTEKKKKKKKKRSMDIKVTE